MDSVELPVDTILEEDHVASVQPEESLITRVKAAKHASTGCTIQARSVYVDACPGGRMIPVYLIVGGLVSIVKILMLLIGRSRDLDKSSSENIKSTPYDAILICFLFAWFIAGNVWIYRWPKDCDTVLLLYTVFLTLATYFVLLILSCCICCGAGITYLVTSGIQKGDN